MNRFDPRRPLTCLGLLLMTLTPHSSRAASRVVAYYPSWVSSEGFQVKDINVAHVTHINYAFAKVSKTNEAELIDPKADTQRPFPGDSSDPNALKGNFHQFQLMKKTHPNLKTLISIGGWSDSGRFSDAALTADSRRKFVASCVSLFLTKWPGVFDGIDIDWEYPVAGGAEGNAQRPEDKANYTALLAEFRKQLDALGAKTHMHYLLTIAGAGGVDQLKRFELDKIHPYLDWINIMAYDFAGSWSSETEFDTPLYPSGPHPTAASPSVDTAVAAYLKAGVPADKLVVGARTLGKRFTKVPDVNHGLSQSFQKKGAGDDLPYKTIVKEYLPTYTRYWSDTAKVPWLYSPATQTWVTYDDPESVKLKTDYVKAKGLGGMMFWSLGSDDGKLVQAAFEGLKTAEANVNGDGK